MKGKLATVLALLTILAAGCGPAGDAVPSAQAESDNVRFSYQFSGARIQGGTEDGQVFEYYSN